MTSTDLIQSVFDQVDRDRDFVIRLTRDLVRIPTVNPKFLVDPAVNREADLQTHLAGVMEMIGLETERWDVFPDRPNVIGTAAGGDETSLILCGHVDVVPVGEESQWTIDPFGGEIRDGRLYGRGSLDMKGGLAATVAAVKAIRDAGIKLRGRLDIHAVVDEESGGAGALDAVAKGKLAKAAIVTEPTWGAVLPAEGGLEWLRVTIRGRAGHAGWRFNEIYPQVRTPDRIEPSVNAVELGLRFLAAVREYERDRGRNRYHPLVPPGITTINPAVIIAGAGIGADGLPTTLTNPAITPDTFVTDLAMKFLPSETSEQVRGEFESFVHHFAQTDSWLREHPPTVAWRLHGLHFPPVDTPVDHPLVRSLVAGRERLGKGTDIKGFIAVSDAAHYAGAGDLSRIPTPSQEIKKTRQPLFDRFHRAGW